MGPSPATGLLWKLQQGQAPAQDCLHLPVRTQGRCQVGVAQSHCLFPVSLESGHGLIGLWVWSRRPSVSGPDGAVEQSQVSFDESKVGAALPHPQILPRH